MIYFNKTKEAIVRKIGNYEVVGVVGGEKGTGFGVLPLVGQFY